MGFSIRRFNSVPILKTGRSLALTVILSQFFVLRRCTIHPRSAIGFGQGGSFGLKEIYLHSIGHPDWQAMGVFELAKISLTQKEGRG